MKSLLFAISLIAVSSVSAVGLLEVWSSRIGSGFFSSPAVGPDGKLFIGSTDSTFYCLNSDGGVEWTFTEPTDFVDTTPVIVVGANDSDYALIFGSWDGFVYAVHSSGDLLWSYETLNAVVASPLVIGQRVFVGSSDGFLYCLDIDDGGLVWDYLVDSEVQSSPVYFGGRLFVGDRSNKVHALDPQTGAVEWVVDLTQLEPFEKPEQQHRIAASLAVSADGLLLVPSGDGVLYALEAEGDLAWYFDATAEIDSQPVVGPDGSIYFGCRDGYLYALDAQGFFSWAVDVGDVYYAGPAVGSDGSVFIAGYAGSGRTQFYQLDGTSGAILDTTIVDGVNDSSPLLTPGGQLFWAMLNGDFYLFDAGEPPAESRWPLFRQGASRSPRDGGYWQPFHQWVVEAFGEDSLSTYGLESDPDGDGVPLGFEFVSQGSPKVAEVSPVLVSATGNGIRLELDVRLSALDLRVEGWSGEDLLLWNPESTTVFPDARDGFMRLQMEIGANAFGRFSIAETD